MLLVLLQALAPAAGGGLRGLVSVSTSRRLVRGPRDAVAAVDAAAAVDAVAVATLDEDNGAAAALRTFGSDVPGEYPNRSVARLHRDIRVPAAAAPETRPSRRRTDAHGRSRNFRAKPTRSRPRRQHNVDDARRAGARRGDDAGLPGRRGGRGLLDRVARLDDDGGRERVGGA